MSSVPPKLPKPQGPDSSQDGLSGGKVYQILGWLSRMSRVGWERYRDAIIKAQAVETPPDEVTPILESINQEWATAGQGMAKLEQQAKQNLKKIVQMAADRLQSH